MAYTRVNWKDYPSTDTPITAANLNKMDEAIDDMYDIVSNCPVGVDTIATTTAVSRDADTLGGRYDADDIEAISDSLANVLTWNELGTVSGSNELTLPTSYNELLVFVHENGVNTGSTIVIPKALIGSSKLTVQSGHYTTSGNNAAIYVVIENNKIKVSTLYIVATDRTSSAVMTVFYR